MNKREYLGPVWPADDIPFCSIFTYFQYSLTHDLALNHAPFVAALFASRRGKINSLWIPSESQVFLRRCRCGLKKNKIQKLLILFLVNSITPSSYWHFFPFYTHCVEKHQNYLSRLGKKHLPFWWNQLQKRVVVFCTTPKKSSLLLILNWLVLWTYILLWLLYSIVYINTN